LDGSSGEVAAQVSVAGRRSSLDVVQDGSSAYVINHSTGSLRRVDGANFQVSTPVTPIPGAGDGLRAFVGPTALYVLDADHGILAEVDPRTLAGRGEPVSLAADIGPQAAAVDGAGRLWLLDTRRGDLDWINDGRRHTRRQVMTPGSGVLTLANGQPVLVDSVSDTAVTLDPDSGAERHRTRLALRPGEDIRVSGSAHADRLYVVAADRSVLAVCRLTAEVCASTVRIGAPGDDLGTAVESAGLVFVPDYTSGRVWILDPARSREMARPSVVPPGTRFQLLARDGLVFYNDPGNENAGVIRLDGGVHKAVKYDPGNPDAGLTGKPGTPAPPPPTRPSPAPTPPRTAKPTTIPPTTPPPTTGGLPSTGPAVRIALPSMTVAVDRSVAMQVRTVNDPRPITAATWTFGDGQRATGVRVGHTWTTLGTFTVNVTATFADGRSSTASAQVTVVGPTVVTVTVDLTSPGIDESVTVQPVGVRCPPTCSTQVAEGAAIRLVADEAGGTLFQGWGGACASAGSSLTCDLTVPATSQRITATFVPAVQLLLSGLDRDNQGAPAGLTGRIAVSDGRDCGACILKFPLNTVVILTAQPKPGFHFDSWSGRCKRFGAGPCTLTLDISDQVLAFFARDA
jgi:hypothetical protein